MSDHNFKELINGVISASCVENWEKAKQEWELISIYRADREEECVCTHFPIKEICVIQNKYNENILEIGNVCVRHFTIRKTGKIFDELIKVSLNSNRSVSPDTLEIASMLQWINGWEFDFYNDTFRKRVLSEKQMIMRGKINRKLVLGLKQQGAKAAIYKLPRKTDVRT